MNISKARQGQSQNISAMATKWPKSPRKKYDLQNGANVTKLDDAYSARDRSRLEIGTAALEIIEMMAREDEQAGHTAPHRAILSEILTQLSQEYAHFHSSERACRGYLSDSIRLARFFSPDKVEELAPYKLTTAHLLACCVGGDWPEANSMATQALIDWTIANKASPEQVWTKRRDIEKQISQEESAWARILRAIERYLEISVNLQGEAIEARRRVCIHFPPSPSGNEEERIEDERP